MSNNNPQEKYPQLIFKAEVVEKDGNKTVEFVYKTQHIPTLDHIVQQLSYDIIELRAIEKAKQEKAKIGLITQGPIQSLSQFLNRKRR